MHCKAHMHCGSLAAHTEDVFDVHFALKLIFFLNPHPLKTKAYFVTKDSVVAPGLIELNPEIYPIFIDISFPYFILCKIITQET